jgi:hypothetical protein
MEDTEEEDGMVHQDQETEPVEAEDEIDGQQGQTAVTPLKFLFLFFLFSSRSCNDDNDTSSGRFPGRRTRRLRSQGSTIRNSGQEWQENEAQEQAHVFTCTCTRNFIHITFHSVRRPAGRRNFYTYTYTWAEVELLRRPHPHLP